MVANSCYSQTFLYAYQKYRLDRTDILSNPKTRKKIRRFIKSQIVELDTIFQLYKTKYNFDFNKADTVFLIYDTPAESPFTSDVIIWSGKDTISYKQGFEMIKPLKYKRIISYEPFLTKVDLSKEHKLVTERDSLLTLVSKRNFDTINTLGENSSKNGGSWYSIYIACKYKNGYNFESYFPKQFFIWSTYQNE